ncbi:DNA-processing protein DprA [Aquibacillus rhizosphaerae]|uniref:DNA-processing protein DprA n=1 Tax=Aquibacillus rhizosphaerae TaxID=3051431 RepID=A0ABT7L4E5_9BACI|nr:DNA-processing protein DprA [Aquibacillus sp. LR5S19]MDL4840050.1 DNA-processing protein DprA [Aquibacillus sp. LR5S19]
MNKTSLRLIHLHRSKAVTRPLIRKILSKDPYLENIYRHDPSALSQYLSLTSPRAFQLYQDLHNPQLIQTIKNDCQTYHVITILDSTYPPLLRTIIDPPYVLYLLGNEKLLTELPSLSVVGTRNPSPEAKRKMNKIITPLILENWVIVSGMAKGIDGIAHQLAIENNGKTIAVVGSGFQHVYPKQHVNLFYELARKQLIISEYPPNIPARRHHFPERNRLISGLGTGTIVVEAKEKSGSLITVDQALDQGRDVYAIPGSPLFEQTSGCHKMIQDGAKLVQNTHDITEDWTNNQGKWCRILSDNTECKLVNGTKNEFHV